MSMTMLTVIQATVVFLLYSFMTCALPFLLLNRKWKGMRLVVKLMLSYVFGNFYLINLVFVLQLLHISNRWTLILGTVIPYIAVIVKFKHINVKKSVKNFFTTIRKLIYKEMGVKLILSRMLNFLKRVTGVFIKKCFYAVKRNILDIILLAALTAILIWVYGENLTIHLGYCASDIPVHNYWINFMSRDQLFVAGVYPFGFHCLMYYLHEVFGIATFVLLRVFCFVQTVYVHWMLLFFLKACLKSGYLPYVGAAIYAVSSFFQYNTYSRFASSLPQEFGMVFIFPAIYFGFAFFEYKKKDENRIANWCLVGFAMNFSLTLAVHFYGTMICGLFCVAMAVAFFFRIFRRKYFGRIVLTCIISVVAAVLPMGIAFATGTPLQGSLGWGMNILTGGDEEEEDEEETETEEDLEAGMEDAAVTEDAGDTKAEVESENTDYDEPVKEETGETETEPEQLPLKTRVINKLKTVAETVEKYLYVNILQHDEPVFIYAIFGSIALLLVLSLAYFIARKPDYAARMVTVALFMIIMSILLVSGPLGLPRLMDVNRTSIYYAYSIPVLICFAADAVIYALFGWTKRQWVMNLISLCIVGGSGYMAYEHQFIKSQVTAGSLQTNDAITCTTNILKDYEDFTWTICSANDELRMTEDYGYHYEHITFLEKLEGIGRNAKLTIPTEYVFFYIEKIPIDYAVRYENSGQSISREGASRPVPTSDGIRPYQGEERWIVMSRMYYWAEAFREMYPEAMTVYYESDEFICYRLKQNIFNLYELGIDYGYNFTVGFIE